MDGWMDPDDICDKNWEMVRSILHSQVIYRYETNTATN